jgi:hypothetical protein
VRRREGSGGGATLPIQDKRPSVHAPNKGDSVYQEELKVGWVVKVLQVDVHVGQAWHQVLPAGGDLDCIRRNGDAVARPYGGYASVPHDNRMVAKNRLVARQWDDICADEGDRKVRVTRPFLIGATSQ